MRFQDLLFDALKETLSDTRTIALFKLQCMLVKVAHVSEKESSRSSILGDLLPSAGNQCQENQSQQGQSGCVAEPESTERNNPFLEMAINAPESKRKHKKLQI